MEEGALAVTEIELKKKKVDWLLQHASEEQKEQ